MYRLVYISTATRPFHTDELLLLLTQARKNNIIQDISGMLLYKSGNFMQVLEGPKLHVQELHQRISRDTRHQGLLTILEIETDQRLFEGWSMGFSNLDKVDLSKVEGYSDFLNIEFTDELYCKDINRCLRLLLRFKHTD